MTAKAGWVEMGNGEWLHDWNKWAKTKRAWSDDTFWPITCFHCSSKSFKMRALFQFGARVVSMFSLLLRFGHAVVFRLGRVPKCEGNHKGRRGHDGKGDPIKNVGREFAVKGLEWHDTALAGSTRVSQGGLAGVFGSEITATRKAELHEWSWNEFERRLELNLATWSVLLATRASNGCSLYTYKIYNRYTYKIYNRYSMKDKTLWSSPNMRERVSNLISFIVVDLSGALNTTVEGLSATCLHLTFKHFE